MTLAWAWALALALGLGLGLDLCCVLRLGNGLGVGLAAALARLWTYDKAACERNTDVAVVDPGPVKEASDLAPVVWAYASVGCFHVGLLLDSAYDRVVPRIEEEKLDLARVPARGAVIHAVIQAVCSFSPNQVIAGIGASGTGSPSTCSLAGSAGRERLLAQHR